MLREYSLGLCSAHRTQNAQASNWFLITDTISH